MLESGNPKTMGRAAAAGVVSSASTAYDPEEVFTALRTLRLGGTDTASRHLKLSPEAHAALPPAITAARWAAIAYGMIFGAQQAFGGSYSVVVSLTVCLFLTSWRSIIPTQLGAPDRGAQIVALIDVAIFGLGVGISAGPTSPFIFCFLVALAVPALGWGYRLGALGWCLGWTVTLMSTMAFGGDLGDAFLQEFLVMAIAAVLVVAGSAFVRSRLIESHERRLAMSGQMLALSEANDLLTMLNSVARTLPASLSQRDVLDNARQQLVNTFHNRVLCLFEYDDPSEEWVPKLSEGATVETAYRLHTLPAPLRRALESRGPCLVGDLRLGDTPGINRHSGSGLYTALVARGRTVGLLALEHPTPGQYSESDRIVLAGMADIVALTLDNARWFGRLRTLGAEEERVRIARDLHDRLGQWLTYISFELERYIDDHGPSDPQLEQLHGDVQTALDELRETLRQLRSTVTRERPFSEVAAEHIERFAERTGLEVEFTVEHPRSRLSVPVENELLRILQETLNNIDKHAQAGNVSVTWNVNGPTASLTVTDDGRGFDPSNGVRESAYGLVGMRERADVIGARISVDSAPDHGTTIHVEVGTTPARKEDTHAQNLVG
ncbi:MAG: GAF domain-containing sensor histidine kinase [Microthrixaceae bacterium]|nr:GAF domain-containing sensor histidine kinase [Microthrixaceae bacterium]MCO5311640.1 GAF domain-containing sensor histidine kinase [Microthrixaceae bacterium]